MTRTYFARVAGELRAWRRWAQASPSPSPRVDVPARADIALVQCPMWSVGWPSLSLGFLSASAEAAGMRTVVFDLNVALYNACPESVKKYWIWSGVKYWETEEFVAMFFNAFRDRIDAELRTLLATGCQIVGFSIADSSRLFAVRLAGELKARSPGIAVIFGGTGVDQPYWRKLVPPSCCDAFAIGEGEHTLTEMYRRLREDGSLPEGIPGLIPNVPDVHWEPRPQVGDLDTLPYPTWDHFPLRDYHNTSLPLLFSRGCISRCSFCTDTFYFKKYRHRSPGNLIHEIRSDVERYGVRDFRFHDLMINGDLGALDGLCEALVSSRLDCRWTAMVMARRDMTQERYEMLLRAGCTQIDLGVESGSDRVLRLMRKMVTAGDLGRNITLAHRAGIKVNISLVVGHPGEKEEDLQATLEFLKSHSHEINAINNINHCLVMFHSDIRSHPESYGVVLPDPPETAFFRWETADGRNTLQVRLERLRRFVAACAALGLNVVFANFYDGAVLDMQEAKRALTAPVCPVP